MQGRNPGSYGQSLTPRAKRVMIVAGVLLLAILGGAGTWAALSEGSYGQSSHGCISVVAASTTGGAIMHECGPRARALCQNAQHQNTKLARLTLAQCRLAGLPH